VHTGEARATRTDVVGHTVNVAARICEAAKGGHVLASAEVCVAVGDLEGVRVGRAKSRRMKGVKTPVRVCEISRTPS
jgi:class 3 adenylate cyclase